jgi:hypothetical protein
MNFGIVIKALREGKTISRPGWPNISLSSLAENHDDYVNEFSLDDVMAEDWEVVENDG